MMKSLSTSTNSSSIMTADESGILKEHTPSVEVMAFLPLARCDLVEKGRVGLGVPSLRHPYREETALQAGGPVREYWPEGSRRGDFAGHSVAGLQKLGLFFFDIWNSGSDPRPF
jgi:hypothetical protein